MKPIQIVVVTLYVLISIFAVIHAWRDRNPLDINHDGKVTLTDLVLARRLEIDIKAELMGEK